MRGAGSSRPRSGNFTVTTPSQFPLLLPSGEETLQVTVRFAPQADADPLTPSEVTGLLQILSDDPDMHQADLCCESAARSGVRLLVTETSTGDPLPVAEVDSITIDSKGQSTPSPLHLRFTDQPFSTTTVCGQEILYHVDQETLPAGDTTGSNPKSSYEANAKEGNPQTSQSFELGQCELREFQLQLFDSGSGACLLLPKGASCTSDGECCSNNCTGPAGGKTCK